jgi:hypothetical protein
LAQVHQGNTSPWDLGRHPRTFAATRGDVAVALREARLFTHAARRGEGALRIASYNIGAKLENMFAGPSKAAMKQHVSCAFAPHLPAGKRHFLAGGRLVWHKGISHEAPAQCYTDDSDMVNNVHLLVVEGHRAMSGKTVESRKSFRNCAVCHVVEQSFAMAPAAPRGQTRVGSHPHCQPAGQAYPGGLSTCSPNRCHYDAAAATLRGRQSAKVD